MKMKIGLMLILLTGLLSAQFEPFYILDEEPGFEQFLGTESCVVDGDIVYWTYLKNEGDNNKLMFARKGNGNINYTIVDELQYPNFFFSKPSISVQENGYINIATQKNVTENIRIMNAYYSFDGGNTFGISDLNFYDPIADSDGPIIKAHNGYVDIAAVSNDFSNSEYSLAGFQHFTDHEMDENGINPIAFSGLQGEYSGPVHSNDDIWISNLGGWPVFYDSVTTAGQFFSNTGTIPWDDVFLGGYAENVAYRPWGGTNQIAQNGVYLGSGADIVYVKMNGSSAEIMFGHINYVGMEDFQVYSWFPKDAEEVINCINIGGNWFEDSDHIWTNEVTIYDTVWSAGPNISWFNSGAYWIPEGELWIEGNVASSVSFGCAENVYIVNDITYSNTMVGMPPDDPNNPNLADYFGLVSEKNIIIKYKHRDPFDPDYPIVSPNCDGNVYLYGAYAAVGYGMIPQDDGIFTYEYQHPHGSTPNFSAPSPYAPHNDTLYTNIDLHKYLLPDPYIPNNLIGFNLHGNNPIPGNNNTCGFPYESSEYINSFPNNNSTDYAYPYGTDYPWYNPVWPESAMDIVNERGTIHLWGSVAQRRKGYMHRSGSDDFNHPPGNHEWDIENFLYNGDHGSTGYYKDYYFDTRFLENAPPSYPNTIIDPQIGDLIKIFRSNDNGENFYQVFNYIAEDYLIEMHYDVHGLKCGIAYQIVGDPDQIHLQYSEDGGNIFGNYVFNSFGNELHKVVMREESVILFTSSEDEDVILEFTPENFNCSILASFPSQNHLSDLIATESGSLIYIQEIEGTNPVDFDFDFTNSTSILGGEYFWQSDLFNLNQEFSNLSLNVNEEDDVYLNLLFIEPDATDEWGKLYTTSGTLENLTGIFNYQIIKPDLSLNIYPNPFNPETTISFSLTAKNAKGAKIEIYNLKGQKVKVFTFPNGSLGTSEQKVVWDGSDDNDKPVSSGIYFCKLKVDGKDKLTKKMLLLK